MAPLHFLGMSEITQKSKGVLLYMYSCLLRLHTSTVLFKGMLVSSYPSNVKQNSLVKKYCGPLHTFFQEVAASTSKFLQEYSGNSCYLVNYYGMLSLYRAED